MGRFVEETDAGGAIAGADATLPLSPEQRAVLAMCTSTSCVLARVDIPGALDVPRLRASVEDALLPHSALRAVIRPIAGFRGLRQRYLADPPVLRWQELDLRRVPDAQAARTSWLAAWRAAPLAIERGELARAAVVRTDDTCHTLMLAVSALAADAGSLRQLIEQVASGYARAGSVELELPFQYAQFVAWREELEGSEDAAVGRAYWERYLEESGAVTPLRLFPGNRGALRGDAGRICVSRAVDRAFAARVADAAATLGADPKVLLQAVWWLLLARLSGFEGFRGGWQHDCRRDYEVMRGAIGVFEKVLPVRVDVRADERFAAWLARLQAAAMAHIELQEYWPVDAPPVADHLTAGFAVYDACAQPSWCLELSGPLPCFELALQVSWSEAGGEISVHADAGRYAPRAVERLLLQFSRLLQSALEQPQALVSALPLVHDEERAALLAMNVERADFGAATLGDHVARWAAQTPDAPALEAGDRRLSYRELEARVEHMARWVRAQGVGPGMLVALNLPRSPELVIAMLAAFRAGAGYLPLEPEWPAGRRTALLADARPALVLHASAASVDTTPAWREASLDEIEGDASPGGVVERPASLDDVAYVLYTSGSTGRPKGVVIEHRQLLNYVAAASVALELAGLRRWALTSSVVADLGNTALFGALFHGACLVIAGEHELRDGEAFARFMSEREIDALKIVPSHLEALLECESPRLPRTLVLGGEAAPRSLIERVRALAPECAIFNHYGPTETTVGVMVHRVPAGQVTGDVLPLSCVLANNRVYVLDGALSLVPAGGLGEVYIGGAQVCRGYLNREHEAPFVSDPWFPGERLYRSGDLAYVLADGGILLAGRADHQVKIRGFRVEPAEVEALLLAQPGVRQAAVTVSDASGALELVAFLVADTEAASDAGQRALQRTLAALLPAHMLPARYVWLAEFPRLPNGKIDRRALTARSDAEAPAKVATPPRDAVEFVLAACLGELLGRDVLDVEEDFFALGVHSLLVIKLVARVRKLLEAQIAPGLVFEHPSVAALAEAVRHASGDVERLERLAEQRRGSGTASLTSDPWDGR